MKLIGFAIASIVDANTGHGLVKGGADGYSAAGANARQAAAGRSADGLRRTIGGAVGSLLRRVRAHRERARQARLLGALNDRQLRDIGLHRGAVEALALGRAGLADLERERRQRAAGRRQGRWSRLEVGPLALPRTAANESRETTAGCA